MSCATDLPTVVAPARTLWSPNFRLYFGARTTSLLGDAMLPVALSVGVLQAGYGASGVGYALGSWLAAVALCMLVGGVLADRFTARRMMVLADLARFVLQAGMAVLFALGTPSLVTIVVLQFLSGVATAMFQLERLAHHQRSPSVARHCQCVGIPFRSTSGLLGVFSLSLAVFLLWHPTHNPCQFRRSQNRRRSPLWGLM